MVASFPKIAFCHRVVAMSGIAGDHFACVTGDVLEAVR
jgi:hypothetical protein